jgi:hypothetical protein
LSTGQTARVVAVLLDKNKIPVQVEQGVEVAFPGSNVIEPNPLKIGHGESFAIGLLSATTTTGFEILSPILRPPTIGGQPVLRSVLQIEIVSPINTIRLESEYGEYVKAITRPSIPLTLTLIDVNGDPIASDKDRTVVLRVDPPNAGNLEKPEIIVAAGTKTSKAFYIPYQEGKAKILASAGQLQVQPITIEFHYRWWFYAFLALIGGAAGGFVRSYRKENPSPQHFCVNTATGAASGLLAYTSAPLLLTISLNIQNLQNTQVATKVFEAFVWGVLGGFGGPSLIADALQRKISGQAALPKAVAPQREQGPIKLE